MEIDYLLFLQNIRETWGSFLAPVMDFITKLSVGFAPIVLVCFIYFVLDRKKGRSILAGFFGALFIKDILKLIFCINRPWILDSRISPFGDSKVAATGYSFPSGHSTHATTLYGGTAMYFRKTVKWFTVLLIILIGLTMLSRNYMGVHTPKDVIVGCTASIVMMLLICFIEKKSDENPKLDIWILIVGLLLCVAAVLFFNLKSYPLEYLADGSLLVDPKNMLADSYYSIGQLSAYLIFRMFEKRKYRFDEIMTNVKDRFIIFVISMIPLGVWYSYSAVLLKKLVGNDLAMFIRGFVLSVGIFYVVPLIMCKVKSVKNSII